MNPAKSRLTQLWQLPLLLLSLGLFVYAAVLFIDAKPGPTMEDQVQVAASLLKSGRPRAAIDYLNKLLTLEPDDAHEARIHLMLGEALESHQKQNHLNIPRFHEQTIAQTKMALDGQIKGDAVIYRRLGDSYAALNRPADAVAYYRNAMTADPAMIPSLQKTMITLQIQQQDRAAAMVSLEEYLRRPDLSETERGWATTEKGRLLAEQENYVEARQLLTTAMSLSAADFVQQGQVRYWLGYCAWKMGEIEDAERQFRAARDHLRIQHALDASAAYAIGRINQDRRMYTEAIEFYEDVLTSHPDAPVAPLSRLGRGVCRIGNAQDEPGLNDLHDLVNQVNQRESRAKYKADVIAGLQAATGLLVARENYPGAMELLTYEQELHGSPPPASFFLRLAGVYENRAEQVDKQSGGTNPAQRVRAEQQARDLRAKAGDSYIAYSRAMTLVDDQRYGESLWKGIQLYNRAGDLNRVISALELFTSERPEDPLAPEALLQLGQSYQAAGLFDKAIAAFHRNQFRYPTSLAASKSAVPLALAYVAKGPDYYGKAEAVLKSIVEDNPAITPEAAEFRQSLFELAQLYYRTSRYEDAIARLEELTLRYPNEARMGQLLFLMADSYRKSAAQLDAKLASIKPGNLLQQAIDVAEAQKAKRDRLTQARDLYDKVIELNRTADTPTDLDKLHMKLSYFYRADCVYDLGQFEDAIKLYDAAAFRYQGDPSALAAYVQIVNANCALGKFDEAKAANERAKWLLRRMPPESFTNGSFSMPKQYWEQWLRWSGQVSGADGDEPTTRPTMASIGQGS